MAVERYECTQGGHNKFWEVELRNTTLVIRFGRIGTDGQKLEKNFETEEGASTAKDKLVKEKLGKGYTKIGAGEGSKAGKIIHLESVEPGNASNEGYVITELLNHCLLMKLTPSQVEKKLYKVLEAIDNGDFEDGCDLDEMVGKVIAVTFKEFDYEKANNEARGKCFDENPDPDTFRQMLEETDVSGLYKKAKELGVEKFILHRGGGGCYSIFATRGSVTEEEMEHYLYI